MKRSALFCVLAACGSGDSGPNMSGIYQVTEMHVSETDCNPQTAPAMPDMYFLLEPVEVSGQSLYLHAICSFGNPACESRDPVSSLDTAIDGGWQGGFGYAIEEPPPPCVLHFDFGIAIETGAGTVEVEERNHAEASSPCDEAEATRRATTMPCVASKRWLGTRIRDL